MLGNENGCHVFPWEIALLATWDIYPLEKAFEVLAQVALGCSATAHVRPTIAREPSMFNVCKTETRSRSNTTSHIRDNTYSLLRSWRRIGRAVSHANAHITRQ